MKFLFMLGATGLATYLGFVPSIGSSRPAWWRAITILAVTATVVLALLPPIAGSIVDSIMVGRITPDKQIPVLVCASPAMAVDLGNGLYAIPATDARTRSLDVILRGPRAIVQQLGQVATGAECIMLLRLGETDKVFEADAVLDTRPGLTLPYILGLEERARIIFFHVPMSWIAVVAYLISMIFGVRYLRRRNIADDIISESTAVVGTLFTVLATLTGAIWAKFNWGSFWNWDPRESSIFILLFVYAAYFVLRSTISDEHVRARISSVYSIVAFALVPFLVFILPRILPGLHPGSADDSNAGPLLSAKSDVLNTTKQFVFNLSLFAFSMVFFWMVNLRIRITTLRRRAMEAELV